MNRIVLLTLLLLTVPVLLSGQQVLEIIRSNKVKTIRIMPGTELTYEIRDYPERWYKGILNHIDVDAEKVQIGENIISIHDITAFREKNKWKNIINKFIMGSSFSTIVTILVTPGIPVNQHLNWIWINAAVLGATIGVEFIWNYKIVRIDNKKRRLNVLDLNFYN